MGYVLLVLFQSVLSVLDLIGLALIMKVVIKFQESETSSGSAALPSITFIEKLSSGINSSTMLIAVVGIFLAKGILSMLLQVAVIKTLALETMRLVKRLTHVIFWNRTSRYRDLKIQDISYAIYNSSEIVFKDTLAPVSIIIADCVLLFAISLNLLISAEVLFLPTVLYFVFIFVFMRKIEKRRTRSAYNIQWKSEIKSRSLIEETTTSLRELYVSSKLEWLISRISLAREQGVKAGAVISIAQLRPKYVYDMALFGGIGVIALVSVQSGNEDYIFTFLTLFVISASRMIPSLLRIQFYLGVFQKSAEQTSRIFEILDLQDPAQLKDFKKEPSGKMENHLGEFRPEISLDSVNFSYRKSDYPLNINNLNLNVEAGETLAIVGPSGSGKSTLVDLILGYQLPDSGSVRISGLAPRDCFSTWPGFVAYVPQKVSIYEGSLFENIAVGTENGGLSSQREKVEKLLSEVGLAEFFKALPQGIDSHLSEMGTSLSGGQVQRIGIARALFSNPSIMVFDESTSSLDSASEKSITELLMGYRKTKTLIFIAHRLSTVRNADRILYLKEGSIIAEGDFETLRGLVPEFNSQVENLNLNNSQD